MPLVLAAGIAGTALDRPVALMGAALAVAIVGVVVVPGMRVRRWRWEVREEEIDLRRGAFTVVRTLVPMRRVQHVDTRRTPVARLFGLASVVVHTAAGTNEIPALTEADAAEIRDRIADLTQTPDEL